MQDRRLLSFIKEEDIPSSAVAWDGTTADVSGNTLYIPIYNNNYCGKAYTYDADAYDYGVSNAKYVCFPASAKNDNVYGSIQIIFSSGEHLDYGNYRETSGHVKIFDTEIYSSPYCPRTIFSALPYSNCAVLMHMTTGTNTPPQGIPLGIGFTVEQISSVRPMGESQSAYSYVIEGYIKVQFLDGYSSSTVKTITKILNIGSNHYAGGTIYQYPSLGFSSNGTNWPHPIYIDTE